VGSDNFFAWAASILSLQVVARAHQRGYRLTAQAFEHQTIAELAAPPTNEAETLKRRWARRETSRRRRALSPHRSSRVLFHSVYEPTWTSTWYRCSASSPGVDFAALAAAWSSP